MLHTISRKNLQVNRHQKGFTLMEVMIASFVLSVGMLGSTAMMLRGLQQADTTNYQAVAVELATNMAERMRSNVAGVSAGAYDNFNANMAANSATVGAACIAACSSAAVATYHADIWGVELNDLFPTGSATATVVSDSPGTANAVFRITVNWSGFTRTGTDTATTQTQSYVMIFQP